LLCYREEYQLDGFVVSDCGGVESIYYDQKYTNTIEDTVAVALHAGTDLNCGSFYAKYSQQALDKKTIVEADIDKAVIRTYDVLVRLGYFDPPESQPYRQIPPSAVDTPASRQFTLESAQQSMVLLKNSNKALPLNMDQLTNKKIALIGPTANATRLMQGNYFGTAPYLTTPLMGFQTIVQGSLFNCMNKF
jgi:beta-glucosidase-like glycosyl hydrolase